MGKHIKSFVFCLLMACTMSLTFVSCNQVSTAELEKEVKDLANEKFSGTGVKATKVLLIHKGGNDYSGTITLSADGEVEDYDIKVVSDGRSFQYEIQGLN